MARSPRQQSKARRSKSQIPTFSTVEEEAVFWDTHDTTAFEDEFEAIDDVRFVISPGRPNKAITVRLAEKTLHELVELAQEHGIGASTLVRMWILQRLYDLQGGSPGTGAKG